MVVKNKRIKPEDKVLASSDHPIPTKNAFGIKEGVHKNTRMSNVSQSLIITCVFIALLVAYAQCCVCGTKAVVTFKPCGHAVICAGCAERVKKCPTCKELYMVACILSHICILLTIQH